MTPTIFIQASAAATSAGCGNCGANKASNTSNARWDGLACGDAPFVHVVSPTLLGRPEQVRRVMRALVHDLGSALGNAEDGAGLVRSLRLETGEAELALAVPNHCGGARLAGIAFQTLRRLLPNTDIYVTHAP